MRVGKVILRKNDYGNGCNESLFGRIKGSFRPGFVLVAVILISAILLAIMPCSANLIAEPALAVPVEQPSGCPCSGGCGPAPASQDSQAGYTENNAISQVAQPASSLASTVQPPPESAPAVSVPAAAGDKPASSVPESTNNNRIADTTGSFSPAGLKQSMPSWWLNNERGSDKPYSIFEKKLGIQPVSLDSVFAGWHKSPVSFGSSFL